MTFIENMIKMYQDSKSFIKEERIKVYLFKLRENNKEKKIKRKFNFMPNIKNHKDPIIIVLKRFKYFKKM